jgi:hypothetical protein
LRFNGQKIAKAEKVTNVVVAGFHGAQRHLQTCWLNGYGVLTDRSMVWSDLLAAKAEIEKALTAMREFHDWPTDGDYGD